MRKVKIGKDIFVREKVSGARRHAFMAGDVVDAYVYDAVLRDADVVGDKPEVEEVKPAEPVEVTGETVKKAGVETKALKEEVAEEAPKATKKGKK